MEAMCDEERYLELHTDIQEKMTYEGSVFVYLALAIVNYSFLLQRKRRSARTRHLLTHQDTTPLVLAMISRLMISNQLRLSRKVCSS
jgi:hypothetical protein